MDIDEFNAFCSTLPAAQHVIQWGGAQVWKVDTKVFAIGAKSDRDKLAITFKTSPLAFDILKEQKGLRPAPYLASRGMKWIQRVNNASMDNDALFDYLRESHRLAALNLSKKRQKELDLYQNNL